ncbi:MAG: thiamine phosphate synthase [Acetobacterales bacterium]
MTRQTLAEAVRRLQRPQVPGLPRLLMMTDERRLPDPLPAARRLPPGSGIVLRHYGDPRRAAIGAALARLCRQRGLVLLVGDDIALATALRAEGIHLPERRLLEMARRGETLRRLHTRPGGGRRLVTVAAHSPATLRTACRMGADAVLLGPVFATASHPGARGIGAATFTRWTRQSPLPVYALGGIDAGRLLTLAGSGACGAAAIGALAGSGH